MVLIFQKKHVDVFSQLVQLITAPAMYLSGDDKSTVNIVLYELLKWIEIMNENIIFTMSRYFILEIGW